jgi:hypothetical protein
MNPTTAVRFFTANDIPQISRLIHDFTVQNLPWEITSVSHTILPNGVISAACSFKFKGTVQSERLNEHENQ